MSVMTCRRNADALLVMSGSMYRVLEIGTEIHDLLHVAFDDSD